MNWGTNYVGAGIMAKSEVSKQNYVNLQSGDILYSKSEGHLIMIHDVFKDEYGRAKYVVYDESFMPKARQLMQKYNDFVNWRTEKGYIVLRNNDIGETDYPAEPYVKGYPDETPESVPDYDIMCNYGDEAVLLEGTDVTINVLNADGYTSIAVYKDNALIQTISTLADFTLSNLEYGEYRVTMQGDNRESSTTFVIVQATCSWDANTHILTFSSANAIPRVVWLNDNGTRAFNMYDVDVTAEDIANGYIDLSDAFTEHPDAVNVRLDFKYNGYTASWFSYFNPAWVIDV